MTETQLLLKFDNYKVGDIVRAARRIMTEATGDSPSCLCANRGDVLEVRKVCNVKDSCWDLYVAHPHITDNSFGVKFEEIL